MKKNLFLICLLFSCLFNRAQKIDLLTSHDKISLRGLSVVNDQIVWASGSQGMVARSKDGGENWQWMQVKNYEKRDFRDIQAFSSKTAIIMAVDDPAVLLKTRDGGKTWKMVFSDSAKGMFLDAMEFWNKDSGIAIGDPLDGKFYIIRSFDGGDSWHRIPTIELPSADPGESCFAASGTNVRPLNRREACFVSGGTRSRLFIRDKQLDLPIIQGTTTTGANSIAVWDNKKLEGGLNLIIVGGDFANDSSSLKNCVLTHDAGKNWILPQTPPHGYKSCVEFITKDRIICCGTSGVDLSLDGGMNWKSISLESFHVCRKAKKGKIVYLAGSGGRIAKLSESEPSNLVKQNIK